MTNTETLTRREYLHSIGKAKLGRGRLSTEAKEALLEARKLGMTFSDDAEVKPIAKSVKEKQAARKATQETTEPVAEDAPVVPKKISDYAPHRQNWTTAQYIEFEAPAGMTWFKTPCRNCGYGVTNCRCSDPHIVVRDDNFKEHRCNRV